MGTIVNKNGIRHKVDLLDRDDIFNRVSYL